MKRYLLATVILCATVVSSCAEDNATAPNLGIIDINPRTVDVLIPYEDFVDGIQVFGGYGSTADLDRGSVALDFDGLSARALMKVDDLPTSVEVVGSDGVNRTDSHLSFVGGRVVLAFDTINGTLDSRVGLELFDVTEDWHGPTVSWDVAVDSAGDRRAWTEPGGGAGRTSLGTGIFDAFLGRLIDSSTPLRDTLSIPIDSAAVARFVEPGATATGFLLTATTPESFLNVRDMKLVLTTVPSTRPDTVLELSVSSEGVNFIVEGVPPVPVGSLRVGGAPSWRSVISMSIPRTVDGTVEVCGAVGCQVDLTEVHLNLAQLVLTTSQTQAGFHPRDTTRLDLRQVLNPDLLPKSPLGGVLLPAAKILPPELFSSDADATTSFAITGFVRDVLGVAAATDTVPDAALALLSIIEPHMIGFASFAGPGGVGAPALRLLFTVANEVELP